MISKRGGQSFPSRHHFDERRLFSISSCSSSPLSPPTHLLIGCSSSLSHLVSCILSLHTRHLLTCCCLPQTSCRGRSLSPVACLLHPMSTEDTRLLAERLLQLVFTHSSPASSGPCERRPASRPACLFSLLAHSCLLSEWNADRPPPADHLPPGSRRAVFVSRPPYAQSLKSGRVVEPKSS